MTHTPDKYAPVLTLEEFKQLRDDPEGRANLMMWGLFNWVPIT